MNAETDALFIEQEKDHRTTIDSEHMPCARAERNSDEGIREDSYWTGFRMLKKQSDLPCGSSIRW
jgi:hypothetical protein